MLLYLRARKLLSTRLFEDENQRRWAKCTSDLKLEVLCVSQFTLYHTMKGNKPDFRQAMGPEESKVLYNKLVARLRDLYEGNLVKGENLKSEKIVIVFQTNYLIFFNTTIPYNVLDGVFGAHMHVSLVNDGPVTLEIESSHSGNNSSDTPGPI